MPVYSVFVVRPFGVQDGFDFDRVERELIAPALVRLEAVHGIQVLGGTTGQITRQGNIRADMFRLLVTSDLVIADVSIHNANVFYELGIRHGLQDRHTFLLRAKTDSKYPFDLQTDRYFLYDRQNLAGGAGDLALALRATLANGEKDSPVFQLLPKLVPHARAELTPAPRDFQEEVELARVRNDYGKLRLIAHELDGLEWRLQGLRLVGQAQCKVSAYRGAKATYEALRATDPDDLIANLRLGTIYQRLSKSAPPADKPQLLTLSDQRIRRALEVAGDRADRAEANSLLGSNAKTRWIDACHAAPAAELHKAALGSSWLTQAIDAYVAALRQRLDDHYPAINVLALLKCQLALADRVPDVWEAQWDDTQDADRALQSRKRTAERVAGLLELALGRDPVVQQRADYNEWALHSDAELILLTQPDRTERVRQAYRKALANADHSTVEATRRNLEVFQLLKLFDGNTTAALEEIATLHPARDARAPERVVLFTGHMIDRPGRVQPRFPPTQHAEARARELIADALAQEIARGGPVCGIAGGACGSDILFHEACEAAGVPAELLVALPEEQFVSSSVQHADAQWVERFRRLCAKRQPRILQASKALPDWLAAKAGYDLWQRNNLWMMFTALTYHARNLTLMALYNPDLDADGPGGTRHLIEEARRRDFKVIELDARELVRLTAQENQA